MVMYGDVGCTLNRVLAGCDAFVCLVLIGMRLVLLATIDSR